MRNTHYALSSSTPLTVAGRRLTSHPSIVRSDWFNANQEGLLPLLRAGKVKAYSVDGVMRISRTPLTFGSAAAPSAVAETAAPAAQAEVTVHDIYQQTLVDMAEAARLGLVQPVEDPPAAVLEAEVAPETLERSVTVGVGIANIASINRLELYSSAPLDAPDLADEPSAPGRAYPQHSDDELLTWKTSELRQLCEDNGVELKSNDTTKSRIIEKWRAAVGAPR